MFSEKETSFLDFFPVTSYAVIPIPFLPLGKTLGRLLTLSAFRMECCYAFPKMHLELSVRHLYKSVSRRSSVHTLEDSVSSEYILSNVFAIV